MSINLRYQMVERRVGLKSKTEIGSEINYELRRVSKVLNCEE